MKYLNKALWLSIFVFCLSLVLLPGCGREPDYSETIEQITALIEQRMQENKVIGLSIALVDGQIVRIGIDLGTPNQSKCSKSFFIPEEDE